VEFVAHALVIPSAEPDDRRDHSRLVEEVAVRVAVGHEQARGAVVIDDVSTPERARAAGLGDHPGFDIHSLGPGNGDRAIEVKGRVGVGDLELTENEWAKAINLRDRYWLYVVYDCGTPRPRLYPVRDPFGTLIARAKGAVVIDERDVLAAAVRE
jgi:hypothetical protein